MTERWRSIDVAPDYEVSDYGRVRRAVSCRNYKAGRILKPDRQDDGHMMMTLRVGKTSIKRFLHQLVLIAFVGPRPTAEYQGAHNNGNPGDNSLGNLRWATPLENLLDKKSHGTWPIGAVNPNASLTDDQVRIIRARCAFGYSKAETGRLYQCSDVHVGRIFTGAMRAEAGGYGID